MYELSRKIVPSDRVIFTDSGLKFHKLEQKAVIFDFFTFWIGIVFLFCILTD